MPSVLALLLCCSPLASFVTGEGLDDRFPAEETVGIDYALIGMEVADMDNDGDDDIVGKAVSLDIVLVYENLGCGEWRRHNTSIANYKIWLLTYMDKGMFNIADMNGDGLLDIVLASWDFVLLINEGNMRFEVNDLMPSYSTPRSRYVYNAVVADFNVDGHLDIVVYYSQTDLVYYSQSDLVYFEGNSTVHFVEAQSLPHPDPDDAEFHISALALSDLDENGRKELLVATEYDVSLLSYTYQDSSSSFPYPNVLWYGDSWSVTSIATGNGPSTIVLAIQESGDIIYLSQRNMGIIPWERHDINVSKFDEGETRIFVTDLDGDGDDDVVTSRRSRNHLSWYENLGDGNFSDFNVVLNDISGNYAEVFASTVADIDGDGLDDILFSCFVYTDAETLLRVAFYRNDPLLPFQCYPTSTTFPTPSPTQEPTEVPDALPGHCPPLGPYRQRVVVENQMTCTSAKEGEVCRLACVEDTVQKGGSGYFVCQSDGSWYPDPFEWAQPICAPLCSRLPLVERHYSGSICSLFTEVGSVCDLMCTPGFERPPNSEDQVECSTTNTWVTPEGVPITSAEFVPCVPKICNTTLGFNIEFFACNDFDEDTHYYEERVLYAVDQEMVIVFDNGTVVYIPLVVGRNAYTTTFNNDSYTFMTIMDEPSSDSHLEALELYNTRTSEWFQSDIYHYYGNMTIWADEVTVDPTPARFASTSVLIEQGGSSQLAARNETPFTFRITECHALIRIRVEAQDGIASTEYVIELARPVATTYAEQRICEAQGHSDCGAVCDDGDEGFSISSYVPLGLGVALFILWFATVIMIRRKFPMYGWFSSETLVFFSTLFDIGGDVCFILVLFSNKVSDLAPIALLCLWASAIGNGVVMLDVVLSERRDNVSFHEWFGKHYMVVVIVAFFSLGNCDAFALIAAGFTASKKREDVVVAYHSEDPTVSAKGPDAGSSSSGVVAADPSEDTSVFAKAPKGKSCGSGYDDDSDRSSHAPITDPDAPWFNAPLSLAGVHTLQRFSWLSLAFDDIGVFAIQLVVLATESELLDIGDLLFVLSVMKVVLLALRVVILGRRTYVVQTAMQNDGAGAGIDVKKDLVKEVADRDHGTNRNYEQSVELARRRSKSEDVDVEGPAELERDDVGVY